MSGVARGRQESTRDERTMTDTHAEVRSSARFAGHPQATGKYLTLSLRAPAEAPVGRTEDERREVDVVQARIKGQAEGQAAGRAQHGRHARTRRLERGQREEARKGGTGCRAGLGCIRQIGQVACQSGDALRDHAWAQDQALRAVAR